MHLVFLIFLAASFYCFHKSKRTKTLSFVCTPLTNISRMGIVSIDDFWFDFFNAACNCRGLQSLVDDDMRDMRILRVRSAHFSIESFNNQSVSSSPISFYIYIIQQLHLETIAQRNRADADASFNFGCRKYKRRFFSGFWLRSSKSRKIRSRRGPNLKRKKRRKTRVKTRFYF